MKTNNYLLQILFLTTFLLMSSTSNLRAQEKYLLRFTPKQGDYYKVEIGMVMESKEVMSCGAIFDIISVNNNIEMDIKYNYFTMNDGDMNYDSRISDGSELSDFMNKFMSPLFTNSLRYIMDDKGKILKEPDLLLLFDINEFPYSEMTPEMIDEMIGDMAMGSDMLVQYPEDALKIGESFNWDLEEDGLSYDAVYTLNSVTDTSYLFKITGDISGETEGNQVTGTIAGEMKLFRDGFPSDVRMTLDMTVGGENLSMIMSCDVEKH